MDVDAIITNVHLLLQLFSDVVIYTPNHNYKCRSVHDKEYND